MNLKYFDAFSGYGGFSLGIQQAYEDLLKTERKQQGRDEKNSTDAESQFLGTQQPSCVGFSEINKYAIQVYEKHFPSHKNFGDITEINPATLPDFDLFCGGFPCQSFSITGKRRGFDDTRGTLFFDIMRIVRVKRPRFILLENVKGLLSHDGGITFDTIIRTIDELGYDIQWQVLNSKNFGVPQNRERVFIIGHTRGTPRPKVFPIRKINEENIILPTITTRITADSNGTFVCKRQTPKQIIGGSQGNRVYDPSGISTTIASQAGGMGAKTGLYMVDDPSRKKGFNKKNTAPTLRSESHGNNPVVAIPVLTPDRPNKRQNGRRFKEDGEPMFTLTGQDRHGVMIIDTNKEQEYSGNINDKENHYATDEKGRPNKKVPEVWKTTNTQEIQQSVRRLESLSESEILRLGLSQRDDASQMEEKSFESSRKLSSNEDIQKERNLRDLSKRKTNGDTPQRQKQAEQQFDKLTRNMPKLSYQGTQKEENMSDMRSATKGSPFVQQALSSMEERNYRIRRLTPTEASRLMGLPDYWFDIKGLSDSQKYKLAGNGVVVPVVKEIIKRLLTNSQKGV